MEGNSVQWQGHILRVVWVNMYSFLIVSAGFYVPAHAEDAATCSKWLNSVAATDHAQPKEVATSSVNTSTRTDPWNISSLPESVKMEAIQCLLKC